MALSDVTAMKRKLPKLLHYRTVVSNTKLTSPQTFPPVRRPGSCPHTRHLKPLNLPLPLLKTLPPPGSRGGDFNAPILLVVRRSALHFHLGNVFSG